MAHPNVIAVIDDEEEVRVSTRDLLRSYGYNVATFESAEAFLSADIIADISAVLTDFKMPGMNADGLLDALRARGSTVPVIVISALESSPTRSVVMAKGAHAFLSKPLNPDELMSALKTASSGGV